ncbi:epimerase [bacterium]|nr:epimerase [bacterium]
MKLLVLGGTIFLGRHVVSAALERGHEVTLFNRGTRSPGLFPGVEKLRGDRDGGLDSLRGRKWDAVLDTSGQLPRVVRASAELLRDAVSHYTFVSSVSVYESFAREETDESCPVARLPAGAREEEGGLEGYGARKALCEEAVARALPDRALSVRPGLIVGPHDPTGRFTYWPARIARGGSVLAPGEPDRAVQVIDAGDLARFLVSCAESRATGVMNATGPAVELGMGRLLEECVAVLGSDARLTWVSDAFLTGKGVVPFQDLPLWVLESDEGFFRVSSAKARARGLAFRPIAETIRATHAWHAALPESARPAAGLSPAREAEILEAWASGRKPGQM